MAKKVDTKRPPAPRKKPKAVTPAAVEALSARARKASRAREARAQEAIAEIRTLFRRSAESAWDLGHALATFVQDELHVALGYRTVGACLKGERLMSENQAYKLIRVARHFSRDELIQLGSVEKGAALIGYADATPEHDTAASLLKDDALLGATRVSKASAEDIDQQTKVALSKRKDAPPESAAKVANAKRAVAREKWVAKQLGTLGWKAARVVTKGARVIVELSVEELDAARG